MGVFFCSMVAETRSAWGLLLVVLGCGCGRAPSPAPTGSASARTTQPAPTAASAPVAAVSASVSAAAPSYACTELPLLSYYRAAGAVLEQTPTVLKLDLAIDLHSLDCGAPDATGHNLVVDLALEPVGEHCWVRSGAVRATPFGAYGEPRKAWHDELRPDGPVDLAGANPADAVLRGVNTSHALVLTSERYWLFEEVKPGAPLHQQLPNEEQGCCYGFTGAATQHWEYEYAPQFSLLSPLSDENQLQGFNVWATRSGLRHQLELLVRRGFPLVARDRVTIELARQEPPLAATVRLSARDPVDGKIGAVLQFSRKPCATCIDGVSGWWLWKASRTD